MHEIPPSTKGKFKTIVKRRTKQSLVIVNLESSIGTNHQHASQPASQTTPQQTPQPL